MGPNKDELLRKANKLAEHERKRRDSIVREKSPVSLPSRMPLGCWIWIALAIALIIWIVKNYGPGI